MSEKVFHPSPEWSANAHIQTMDQYQEIYDRSISPVNWWDSQNTLYEYALREASPTGNSDTFKAVSTVNRQ